MLRLKAVLEATRTWMIGELPQRLELSGALRILWELARSHAER